MFIHNQVRANELNAYSTEGFRTGFGFRDDCDFELMNYILHGMVSSCVKWSRSILMLKHCEDLLKCSVCRADVVAGPW